MALITRNPKGSASSVKPILIVKTGGTYPDMAARYGDFEDWFIARMDSSVAPIQTVSPFLGESLPQAAFFGGIIITGSHDMVTEKHPWSEKTADWVKQAVDAEVPLLGVCYGHQLLAHAMGGVVGDNPNGKAFGTVTIRLNQQGCQDRLFEGVPGTFAAHVCHSQCVLQLPDGATLLASSDTDPHHAFVIGRRAWGVQFHPEFGGQMLRRYIQRFADDLKAQGLDVERLLADIRETPQSEALLRRFQRLCT
jgi:GMP synthase (glutamine-hydrolysing)